MVQVQVYVQHLMLVAITWPEALRCLTNLLLKPVSSGDKSLVLFFALLSWKKYSPNKADTIAASVLRQTLTS